MIDALGLEYASLRQMGGGMQVELHNGQYVGLAEGSWVYRFTVMEDLNLRDDTPVRVTVNQEDVSGFLVSFRDSVLIVALERNLGPTIAEARLVADSAFIVERLKKRLEMVRDGEAQFNSSAAERVFGIAAPQTADAEPHPLVTQDVGINADQLCAVRRSLGSDTTFVWGPPGTGKTTTLARVVEAHYRAGRSVLLVSNTNIAVDTALEFVAERLCGETDFHQGLVIRHGPVVKEELRQRFGPQVILGEILARLGEPQRREKELLTNEAVPLETEEKALATMLDDLRRIAGQISDARATLAEREKARDLTISSLAARNLEAEPHRIKLTQLRADLTRARKMGAVRRFFAGLDPKKLERNAATAQRDENATVAARRWLTEKITSIERQIGPIRSRIDQLLLEASRFPTEPQVQSQLDLLRTRLGQIRERINVIERELAEIEQHVLARCKILATTVYRTYLRKNPLRQFDVVVVDEASMLMPPLVYYVAGLATQSVTIAGDFRQLSPIIQSREPLAEEWLKRDVFEIAGIPQALIQHQYPPHLVELRTQYRMQEPICAVINKLFYNDYPLHTAPNLIPGKDFPLGTAPLLYVNTAPFHPWAAFRTGTYTRYNIFHAMLIQKMVLRLAEAGYLPPAGEPNNAIGVVAPYTAQARLIQALLVERLGSRAAGVAATVHRFQGNEKQTMVIDLTDSLGVPLGFFLRATRLEEDGARLLNVAVSRAKHHVVLLGNFDYLREEAPHLGFFVRQLIDHFKEHGHALDIDELLPLAEPKWVDGLHNHLPASFTLPDGVAGAFDEETFYPAFRSDLESAKESIIIVSPFATGRGTRRWVDLLREARVRNVHVCVITLPPEEPRGDRLIAALRDLGATVDARAQMHEKIAILDGHILWHGSLNILSHRDTHESMLRIDSPTACQQIGRFVSVRTN